MVFSSPENPSSWQEDLTQCFLMLLLDWRPTVPSAPGRHLPWSSELTTYQLVLDCLPEGHTNFVWFILSALSFSFKLFKLLPRAHTQHDKLETFISAELQELFGRLQVITSKFWRFTTEALVWINWPSYSYSTTGLQRVSAMLKYTKQVLSEQFNSYFWMIFFSISYFFLKNFLSSTCLQRSSVKL